MLSERETRTLAVKVEGVAEKAKGAGGKGIPGREESGIVGHDDGPFGVTA
ncbi:hypothetical protein KDH_79370 [Dictyobacter sp. S3.2.2.5]|uniref:Uncharacterized protein n=1 Tax=Dictyobacter halimunensis TaxID=3026934 RepID=A0ABQ6G3M0_9CHLR|nr:hypothetical protein KDH_79370 [Dictyobacter sp. S3.2.2.5]